LLSVLLILCLAVPLWFQILHEEDRPWFLSRWPVVAIPHGLLLIAVLRREPRTVLVAAMSTA